MRGFIETIAATGRVMFKSHGEPTADLPAGQVNVHRVQPTEFGAEYAALLAHQEHVAFKARVAALLREIEFHVTVGGGGAPDFDPEWHLCPKCGRDGVHAPGCELAALLKEAQA